MKNKFGIKEVVATGIGTALFIVLTNVQIPLGFIPNTSLQPRAALLAFFAAVFGPVVGGIMGLAGHAIGDAIFYGSVWWSWVFPDAVFGIAVGLFAKQFAVKEGGFTTKQIVKFNVVQVIGNLVPCIGCSDLCGACKEGICAGRSSICSKYYCGWYLRNNSDCSIF